MMEENNYEQDTEYDWKDIDELFPKNPWFKKALVKPFNKLIFALALTGAVTGSISLIIGSVAVHNDGLNYYLKPSREAVWGKGTIWVSLNGAGFYFAKHGYKDDIKWDGTYPKGYFND